MDAKRTVETNAQRIILQTHGIKTFTWRKKLFEGWPTKVPSKEARNSKTDLTSAAGPLWPRAFKMVSCLVCLFHEHYGS